MALKVYADRMSQPSRAILIFCKVNGIDFEEVKVRIAKREHLSAEYEAINPMKKIPSIADGRFKLFESHAIFVYISCAFPGVADHWYPADLSRRAKIHSVLDWHHSNLRRGSAALVLHTVLAPTLGLTLNSQAAVEAERILSASLSKIESFWLKENGLFLLGGYQPSIADLSLVCELMQLEILDEEHHRRILGPYKKVQQWIEHTRKATAPHFEEVHTILFEAKDKFKKQRSASANGGGESSEKTVLPSKI